MIGRTSLAFALAAAFAVVPALAHHSGTMFDQTTELELKGTVKEFQYTAPHSWIQLLVMGDDGQAVEWSVETAAPIVLLRRGIKPSSLQPGDAITVKAHPLKDGAPGAEMVEVIKADGTLLSMRGPGG